MADADVQGLLIRIEATTAQLRQELAAGESAVAKAASQIDRSLGSADSSFDRLGKKAQATTSLIRGAMAGIAGAGLIGGLIKQADAYGQMADRMRAATSSSAEYEMVQKHILTTAQETYRPLHEAQELYIRTADVMKGLGYNTQQTLNITDSFSYLLVTNAASADKAGTALDAYSKSLQTGKIDADSWVSIMTAMPTVAEAVATATGKTSKEIRKLGAEGKLGLGDLNRGLEQVRDSAQKAAAQMSTSVMDALNNINNAIGAYIGKANESTSATGELAKVLDLVAKNIDIVAAAGAGLVAAGVTGYMLKNSVAAWNSVTAMVAEAKATRDAAAAKVEATAASAALAAVQATETSAVVVGARSTEASAIAKLRVIQAARDQLAYTVALSKGTQEEARYTAALAATDIELAAAKKAAFAASAQLGAALTAESAAMAKDAAATTAASVAKEEYAAVSSLAARAGSGLLALLGGPVGIAALAVGAGVAFLTMRDGANEATSALIDQNGTLEDSIQKFKGLSAEQQRFQSSKWVEAQESALDSAASSLTEYATRGSQAFTSLGMKGVESAEAFSKMVAEVKAGTRSLDSVTEWVSKNNQIMPSFKSMLEQTAAAYSASGEKADKYGKLLAQSNGVTNSATTETEKLAAAQAAASKSSSASAGDWDKYIAKLTEARDLIGANAAAEAEYNSAKMGASAQQVAQAKLIGDQTDTLKKYQEAIKEGDKVQQASLKLQLVALYTAEDAATQAAATQSKAYGDTATAAEDSARRQITAVEQAANFAVASATRVAMGASAPQANLSGYGLLTNGGIAPAAPVAPKATPGQRAQAAIDQLNATTDANKRVDKSANDAATAIKNQAKALTDLQAQADIAIKSATGLAAAYLDGTDKSREFSLQEKVDEALLKTGSAARDEVIAKLTAQQDAQDKLNISKSAYDLGKETADIIAQAKATLMGADALAAYNLEKSMTIALAGKNIEVGSKEYEQLLAANKAQQDALKIAQRAANAGGIMDRLYPEAKLLKDYTEDQKALNAAMALYPENAANYQSALLKLGNEYEVNRSKATLWGQMTEGAIDRIDEAFATAWGNIGSGAESLWDNLKKGFKQTLGEIAHMLTTKPLLASISNWLTGTDNGQGLSSVWGKLLGGASGSSSSSGGGLFGSGNTLVSMGKSIYQAYSAITGVGSSIASGYASGGVGGAISGGVGYYGNLLSSLGTTLSGGFSSIVGAITGSTATQVAANAATSAALQGAVAQGATQVGTSIGIGGAAAAGAGTAAAAGAGAGFYASLAAMASNPVGWVIAAVTSAYQSGKLYDQGVRWNTKDVMNTDLVKYSGGIGQATLAPLAITNNVLEKIVGGKMAAIFSGSTFASAIITKASEKIFGGSWVTKDGGLSLGIDGGDFDARQYINQKKKGGLFSSSKKRTRYSALDPQMEEALQANYYDTQYSVLDLFARLNVALNDGVMDGLNVADTKISTKGKTADQIQEAITKWFGGVADSMVSAVDSATNSGLGNYNFEELTTFVNNLYSVNDSFEMLGLKLYGVSVSTGFMAEQLIAMAGGLEALKTAESTFFDGFYTDVEKADYALSTVNKQFASMGVTLPATREAYRGMVEALDLTTESGRQMYIMLTGMSDSAAQAFDILESRTNALNESMMGAVTGAQGALQRAISAQQKKATEAYNATNTSLNDMVSTVTEKVNGLNSVSSSLSAALKALRGDSDDAVKMLRAQAQATLQSALSTARSGKSLSGFTGLDDALDTVSNNNTGLYGSMEAFARDQGRTANVVAELNALNGKQLTSAEKSLEGLKAQIDQAKKSYDLQMSQYDAQLTLAQAQIDALNGVDNSVVSVAAAVNSLSQAIVASLAIKGDDSARQNTFDNNAAIVRAVYRTVLGRDAEAKGLNDWAGALTGGLVTYDELMASIARQGRINGENVLVPGFASGGVFSGGLRLVGERGPELEVTGPSRIYTASQTAAMLGGDKGGATAAEVRELRAELKSALFAIAKYTQKAAKNTDLLPQKLEQELFS
ncbi:tape measure protein [Pseudomonas lactis]|uniref:tape measure protein n=1 Tax=Pseudomonas lactis TaxID=1615674 RepID=UPI0014727BB8|nr:tape measure protein [Pseudomonas lactis]NNA50459.1 tape measure protein [Pseudomonas lactis]